MDIKKFENFDVNETSHNDDKLGINLRSLLDGELASYITNYEDRNNFITKIEKRLMESDWISMSNGMTFTPTFEPKKK